MKKILSSLLLLSFLTPNIIFATENIIDEEQIEKKKEQLDSIQQITPAEVENLDSMENIFTITKNLNKKEYKRNTIFKYYSPLETTIKNTNNAPILLTTETTVNFIKSDNSVIQSASRRNIYNRTRKRDRARHYALQVPGVILGTAVSVGTFLMGTPIGYGIYKAMQYPTVKAARTNVNIAQDLYSTHNLPLRLEPNVEYTLYFYPPQKTEIKTVVIKNVLYKDNIVNIEIPLNSILVKEEL